MAGRHRSKGGCWTCKLRKKKCDEAQPSCAACLSLGISCHGYGPRPVWMDGGSAEKAKLEAWRQKVKEITNHKRKLRVRQNAPQSLKVHNSQENNHVPIIPKSVDHAHLTPQSLPPRNEVYSTALNKAWTPRWPPGRPEDSTRVDSSSAPPLLTLSTSDLDQEYRLPPVLGEEETGLLMYYLDYVFPLQFPFYKHSAFKGGRGWLLSLLMQLEPLYHAALSISSYHMHFETLTQEYELRFGSINNTRELPTCCRLESQLTEHILTLSRISKLLTRLEDLERSRPGLQLPEYIELIACMATLISLEVLEGSSDSWQIHLNAASYILPLTHQAFQSDQVKDLSNTHKEAYRFFSTALTWYIFQSYAATGTMLPAACAGIQLRNLCTPLSDFTGCDEWVTQEILNIIKLANWKETMKSKKQLSNRELTTRAREIDTKLKSEMSVLSARIERCSHLDFFDNPSNYIKLFVTRIFGYSTLIYLYTIESGPCPDVPEIHTNVSKTIEAFKALPQAEVVRSLSWPLCIAGSMATGDQQAAFLEIATKAKINRCPFGSSKHALAIIEECWRMRKSEGFTEENVDWRIAMRNLGVNILLA
ncbi:Zn2 DNA-binding protein-1 [Coleophoma crateriformis]|uniref:Zn2 DNA-binding protein-1 n=1 Tax=Coleophoma crateriformis TaxID=565419 RepID=A0A3D8SM36_9HELO|nr:Zn2 DNA-binding protein-1 [Coleophoma crateriformis]